MTVSRLWVRSVLLVLSHQFGLLQKPESGVLYFLRLEVVDLFPALHIDIERKEGQVVDRGIEDRQFFREPVLPQFILQCPAYHPFQDEDKRNRLRGRKILDRPDPDDAVEKRRNLVRDQSRDKRVKESLKPLGERVSHRIRELGRVLFQKAGRVPGIGLENGVEPFFHDDGLLLREQVFEVYGRDGGFHSDCAGLNVGSSPARADQQQRTHQGVTRIVSMSAKTVK